MLSIKGFKEPRMRNCCLNGSIGLADRIALMAFPGLVGVVGVRSGSACKKIIVTRALAI